MDAARCSAALASLLMWQPRSSSAKRATRWTDATGSVSIPPVRDCWTVGTIAAEYLRQNHLGQGLEANGTYSTCTDKATSRLDECGDLIWCSASDTTPARVVVNFCGLASSSARGVMSKPAAKPAAAAVAAPAPAPVDEEELAARWVFGV